MSRATQRGFSLVEVMVSMVIGLILIGGAISVLYSSKVTYNENERVSRLQESGRAAIELMLHDMRAGGFKGCNQTVPLVNVLSSPTGILWNFAAPVQGFDATATAWSPAVDAAIISPRVGSDILAVRTARIDAPSFTTNGTPANSTTDLTIAKDSADTLPSGTTLMVSDCTAAAVFATTAAVTSGSTTATLTRGGADLGIPFPAGAVVVPVDTVIYYIRDSDTVRNGVKNPSLWRKVGPATEQELIEGIEAMQVLYGVDSDGDRLVNSYEKASAVTNWNRVISVSIALLIRSLEPNALTVDTKKYTLLDTDFTPPTGDKYERTLYTTTVALRNNTQ